MSAFRARTGLTVYLEPGQAIALGAGLVVAQAADLTKNDMALSIVDVSATCHMPDVIEAPYRPDILGAGEPGERAHTYRIGGPTCLSGDIIGDYSFDRPLEIGRRLAIDDQAYYTMVKSSTARSWAAVLARPAASLNVAGATVLASDVAARSEGSSLAGIFESRLARAKSVAGSCEGRMP